MSEEIEIKKKTIEKAGNTMVKCPYCNELHSVASGWFFIDNPNISRDGNKTPENYITKQLAKFLHEE